jgi:predicted nucleotidyltransferase component of viral defense system
MHNVDFRAWIDAANGPTERSLRQAIHTVVVAITRNRELHDSSYLKGGILLALRYASTRHTTDLDFSNVEPYSEGLGLSIVDALTSTLPAVVEELGHDLDCRLQSYDVQPSPRHTYVNLEMKIGYAAKGTNGHRRLERGQATDTLSIDYNFLESVPERELIEIDADGTLCVYAMTTLVAEKYRAMLQQARRNRMRRQDVYDLNYLIENYGPFTDEERARMLASLISKCEERDFAPTQDSMASDEVYRRAQAEYANLAAEVEGTLPDFDASFGRVREFYENLPWSTS